MFIGTLPFVWSEGAYPIFEIGNAAAGLEDEFENLDADLCWDLLEDSTGHGGRRCTCGLHRQHRLDQVQCGCSSN